MSSDVVEELADACLVLGIALFLTSFVSDDASSLMSLGILFMSCSVVHTWIRERENARRERREREDALDWFLAGLRRWRARAAALSGR
jgi:hypothetical protein